MVGRKGTKTRDKRDADLDDCSVKTQQHILSISKEDGGRAAARDRFKKNILEIPLPPRKFMGCRTCSERVPNATGLQENITSYQALGSMQSRRPSSTVVSIAHAARLIQRLHNLGTKGIFPLATRLWMGCRHLLHAPLKSSSSLF